MQPFTREYARSTPAEFEAALLDGSARSGVVVGHDFTYGQKRAGTVETLAAAAAKHGAELIVVPPVTVDGVVASSTKVREYVLEGRVAAAARLLGRPFDLDGRVVHGAGRGRTIGFPTANVDTAGRAPARARRLRGAGAAARRRRAARSRAAGSAARRTSG